MFSRNFNRRGFLRRALATGAGVAIAPAALTLSSSPAHASESGAQFATDLYLTNFALNLEYLEAEYYSLGVTGQTIEGHGIDTSGENGAPSGTVTVKSGNAAAALVPFVTPAVQELFIKINTDETAHVLALRSAITARGGAPQAIPNIDLYNSFTALGVAAGLGPFDPFASESNFLLGAFFFEDVGVTAYLGDSKRISDRSLLFALSSILPVEAAHAAAVRTFIFGSGTTLSGEANAVSMVRDALDTPANSKDQGVSDSKGYITLVPTNPSGLAFARSARQVMNILYGEANAAEGWFFPNGMNLPTP